MIVLVVILLPFKILISVRMAALCLHVFHFAKKVFIKAFFIFVFKERIAVGIQWVKAMDAVTYLPIDMFFNM